MFKLKINHDTHEFILDSGTIVNSYLYLFAGTKFKSFITPYKFFNSVIFIRNLGGLDSGLQDFLIFI